MIIFRRFAASRWTRRLTLLALMCALAAPFAYGRAGGGQSFGGGGRSSGGGFSSGSGSSYRSGRYRSRDGDLIRDLERFVRKNPLVAIPMLVGLAFLMYYGSSVTRSGLVGRTIVKGNAMAESAEMNTELAKLRERDPGFDPPAFLKRAGSAFQKIQDAWSKQDMAPARAFISDGVMERFSIQIEMMKKMGLRNAMENVQVLEARVTKVESDKHFDTIHVGVRASAVDTDVSLQDGRVLRNRERRPEAFVEVWSFLRRPGTKTLSKPGLIEGLCPNCGAPLEISDAAKCGSCESLVNSGEYDWVLAEITQAGEWRANTRPESVMGFCRLQAKDPALNIQFLEDRASVAFWRWQLAHWEPQGESLQSVATDEVRKKVLAGWMGKRVLYRNAAVGGVEVAACETGDRDDKVHVQVRWSGERFIVEDGQPVSKGQSLATHVFTLSRKSSTVTDPKSGLRSSRCSSCGAPPSGRHIQVCEFCQTPLNDGSRTWIVSDVVSRVEWKPPPPQAAEPAQPAAQDAWDAELAPAHSLAILIAGMAMDGHIDPRELAFAQAYAKKHQIPEAKIQQMIQAVRTNQLIVPQPQNPKQAEAYLRGLIHMSLADGTISNAELRSLLAFGQRLRIPPGKVKALAQKERDAMYRTAKSSLKA